MRNVPLDIVDALPRETLAIRTDYAKGTVLDTHSHRRAQFLYGATGLMEVDTDDGAWVVPPHSGVWIPAGKLHRVRMMGVSTCSLYIEPEAAPRTTAKCEVLMVSPMFRQLLLEAADTPALYESNGRDGLLMSLMLHEIARAKVLPFFAPLPRDAQLASLCTAFLHRPLIQTQPSEWAKKLHKSERTFSRFFRAETGMAFGEWRQQACLISALALLSTGKSVTAVALEIGYESPGAFSTMFRKRLACPPSDFAKS